jgi:serine/threonine protein kinase
MNQPQHESRFSAARRIDQLCDQFEDEWSHDHRPSMRAYLSQVPEPEREELLQCLLPLDMELRQAAGEQATVNSYLEELPEHSKAITDICLASEIGSAGAVESETSEVTDASEKTFHSSPQLFTSDSSEGSDGSLESDSSVQSPGSPLKELVGGRFQICRQLGQGAMGSVYLAQDTQLKRFVALKVPRTDFLCNSQALSRFYREARAAAQLRHPGICPVYDLGESDGIHFISMAWIEGQTLQELLESDTGFRDREIATLVQKLSRALGEAHRHGVVHRDLKPANIMIDQSGESVITDFGLAQLADRWGDGELTHENAILGTPAYMSPEQAAARHGEVGPASDIYSLGVILFRILVGRLPFEGDSLEVLAQKHTTQPPAPSDLRENIDPELEAICLRMMATRIEDRYASMEAVEADLTSFLTGRDQPVETRTEQSETASESEAAPQTEFDKGADSASDSAAEVAAQSTTKKLRLKDTPGQDPDIRFPSATVIVTAPDAVPAGTSVRTASGHRGRVIVWCALATACTVAGVMLWPRGPDPVTDDPPQQVAGPPDSAGTPVVEMSPARLAVELALKCNGVSIVVTSDGAWRTVTEHEDLPGAAYRVRSLVIANHPEITDADVAWLDRLTSLEYLSLYGLSIGDETAERVAGMESLKTLAVGKTRITDVGVVQISRLSGLESLHLQENNVSDRSVSALSAMKGLKTLNLFKTGLSDNAIATLRKALPDCDIQTTVVVPPTSLPPLSHVALVPQPRMLPGAKSWSIETIGHRGYVHAVGTICLTRRIQILKTL